MNWKKFEGNTIRFKLQLTLQKYIGDDVHTSRNTRTFLCIQICACVP